jgi:hypothetical protein
MTTERNTAGNIPPSSLSPTNQKPQNKHSCLGLLHYAVLPGTCCEIVNAFKESILLQHIPETYEHATTKTTEVYTHRSPKEAMKS